MKHKVRDGNFDIIFSQNNYPNCRPLTSRPALDAISLITLQAAELVGWSLNQFTHCCTSQQILRLSISADGMGEMLLKDREGIVTANFIGIERVIYMFHVSLKFIYQRIFKYLPKLYIQNLIVHELIFDCSLLITSSLKTLDFTTTFEIK